MNAFKHINISDRKIIAHYLRRNKSYRWIAKELNIHHSSISREIQRNSNDKGEYKIYYAQRKSIERQKEKQNKNKKIKNNWSLSFWIEDRIKKDNWTPEEVVGRLKYYYSENNRKNLPKFIKTKSDIPSVICIYRWVFKDNIDLKEYLEHRGKRYKYKRNQDKYRKNNRKKNIKNRPDIIEVRDRFGDFEGDTIVGKNRKDRILTLVDRKSRYLFAHRTNADSYDIHNKVIKLLKKETIKSITYDNGVEFYSWELTEKILNTSIYFADPYSSYQRGTNEYTNRLIRRYFPKGYDFVKIDNNKLNIIVKKINNRPRKCLNFLTPHEVYVEKKVVRLRC